MAKKAVASRAYADPDMRPHCSICNRMTPHLFKGIRYCVAHHPAPSEHIRARAAA